MAEPLTAAQHGIWTGQALSPGSPMYNAGEYVDIRGSLDVRRFEAALREVIGAAPALHAVFSEAGQVVRVVDGWPLRRVTVSSVEEAEGWMREDLEVCADLAAGPLFAQALIRVAEDRHLWYQRIHHIAADGYAFSLLARRVADVCSGRPGGFGSYGAVLEEAAVYEHGLAAGDRSGRLERLTGQRERDRRYWEERCAGMPAPPLTAPAAPVSGEVHRRTAKLPGRVPPEVAVAVTAAYLHARTGAPEVVLGLPVMNRLGSAALKVPCMAMNIVPLRVPVSPSATLSSLAAHVAGEIRLGRPHHRYRYEWLRRDLGLVGGDRRLFGPVVNVLPFGYDLRFGEARGTVHNVSAGPVEDLSIAVSDRGGPCADFDASAAAYSREELDAHADAWLSLLQELTADPGQPLSRAWTPPPGVVGGAAPAGTGPAVLDGGPLPVPAVPVAHLIAAQAAATPHAVAVEQAGRRLTYRDLLTSARSFADEIAGASLVAIMLPRGFDAVTAIVGAILSGAAYLPLDPAWPQSRIDGILAAARPGVLVTAAGVERLEGARSGPGLAYVMYTSGSTGRPKGVAVGQEALAHFVAGATSVYGIGADDRVLQFAPLHFDASVEEIFLTLCAGATLVLRTDEMLQSVGRLLQACADLGVTVLDLPTAFWHEVAYALSTGTAGLPPGVRTVIIGGEAALPERVARWHAAVRGSARLFNTYGPTEATVVATVAELVPGDPDVPIGKPLPGVRAAVVDGELVLMGGGLARGYLDAPFDGHEGEAAYRTGDRVRLRSDGQLVHLGRIDDEFKISGHRVDPGEVESALLLHPGVREAAVVGQVLDGGAKRLVAHVVPVEPVPAADLRRHLAGLLPAAVIPSAYVFAAALPRTTSGKIDRSLLRETAAEAAPQGGDGLERVVIGVWEEVLGATGITPADDFFQLGGQSLQTIQVVNRLAAELGHDVPATLLFRHPTASAFAAALPTRTPTTPAPAEAASPATATAESAGTSVPAHVADAVLPPEVRPRAIPSTRPPTYLLTGATGFVGAHLLSELLSATDARIACPVRAADEPAALRRLADALAAQDLPEIPRGRVLPIPADLTRTELSGDYQAVYHNAAVVSVTRPYSSMRAANVTATLDLLRLGVPFHYISTLAVAAPGPDVPEEYVPPHPGLRDGYTQSKWASEELVRQAAERGLRAAVYRLGRVAGAHGHVNPGDLFWRIVRAAVLAGARPDLDLAEPWTPVDYAARAVVTLSRTGSTGVHNLAPLPPIHLAEAMDWIAQDGYDLPVVPLPDWVRRVRDGDPESAATATFFDLTTGPPPAMGHIHAERSAGIACPPIDRDTMRRHLAHCRATGLLPPKGTAC
ncbi:thioester reductase domain-containing protein [Nonomuraea sp. SBT364]|uniref:thioester reductase domain-containing protein n=1 Tax=Nonomuraea sp. SBT364 TaxID=1580530 RepID=UPI00066D46E5|nr:thioester reductase domain-containing protein [Nonomuraea sp. SBT364]